MIIKTKSRLLTLLLVVGFCGRNAWALVGDTPAPTSNKDYCVSSGGSVVKLHAEFDTHAGFVGGVTKEFCQYVQNSNVAIVGLDTLSTTPTLAATYTQKLVIDTTNEHSNALPQKPYSNPALNVCLLLHGSEIAFSSADGGFAGKDGQADVCIFGDGSAISAWSMIYAATGARADIIQHLRSAPLAINIPSLYAGPTTADQ